MRLNNVQDRAWFPVNPVEILKGHQLWRPSILPNRRLSRTSIADEMREEHHRRVLGE
jgi:hypothetical protein